MTAVVSNPRLQLSHFTTASPQNLQRCYLTPSTVTCRTNDELLSTKSGTPPLQYASDLHLRLLEGHLPALDVGDEALTFLLQQVRAAWEPASVLHPRVIPRLPVVQRSVTAKTSHTIAMTCTQGKEKNSHSRISLEHEMYAPRAHLRKGALRPHYCYYVIIITYNIYIMGFL